ncbi:hypothetical protein AAUPMC_13166, partial [Pasteurella multocida subsp. multocida str. Anand1_cattle]
QYFDAMLEACTAYAIAGELAAQGIKNNTTWTILCGLAGSTCSPFT